MSANDYVVGKNPVTGETISESVRVLTDGTVLYGSAPEMKLATVTGVDLNNAATPALYTVPNEVNCIITKIVLRNASTSLTTVSLSIGQNASSYNDILANATHTELTGPTLATVLSAKTGAIALTPGTVLKLKNNTQQGGAATCTIDIFGILF